MKKKVLTRYSIMFLIVGALVGMDILTKVLFDDVNIKVLGDFFVFLSTKNYGASLGILSGQTILLIVLSIIFIIGFIVFDYFYKNNNTLYFIAINLIFAGAIGNLIDRIFLGYVRDFIYINLPFMPYYFNLADVFLTFGVILILIEILFKKDKKKEKITIKTKEENDGNENGK